jgi:hypothetical protein
MQELRSALKGEREQRKALAADRVRDGAACLADDQGRWLCPARDS